MRNIFHNIKRLLYWFPIIWKDRDWDEHYLFIVLQHKLKSMENFFRNHGHFIGTEKQAENIKICVLLLQRLIDDNYLEIAFKFHEKKWGNYNSFGSKFYRDKVTTEAESKQEHKESLPCDEREQYLRVQDLSYLFHILAKHVWAWWA